MTAIKVNSFHVPLKNIAAILLPWTNCLTKCNHSGHLAAKENI